jgi:hypothetical protein
MKTPDSDPAIHYGQSDAIDGESIQKDDVRRGADPLSILLTENLSPDTDSERLYTDEFIRANEKASRSLFLGFLGTALLGTSLFAWFILSQPKTDQIEDSQEPVSVPSDSQIYPPDSDFNSPQLAPSPQVNPPPQLTPLPQPDPSPQVNPPPQAPISNPPNAESPQSPLVFPIDPVIPDSSPPPPTPIPEDSASPPSVQNP